MDMFNVKRRDNPSMDRYTDIKKPAFGGPNEKADFDKIKHNKLEGYQRVIDRNADFEGGKFNHNYDTTWKAITRDLISRRANKKPFDPMYAKPTIATVDAVEEGKILRFEQFVNENDGFNMFAEAEDEIQDLEENPAESPKMADEAEVDPEQLENLMAEFGEDLEEMIADIAEKMEMEKDQICDLLCAAVKKLCNEEAEEEAEEGEEDGSDDDSNEVKDEE
jgi:hypothetical protein